MSKGKFGSSCSQTLNSQETQRQRPVGGAYLGWSIVRILLLYLYFSTFWGTLIINVFKWYVKAQSLFFGRQKQIELLGVFNQIVWGCKWGEQKHNPCRNRRPSFWSGTGRNYNPRGNKIFSWFCEKARKGMGPFWLIQRLRAVEFASEMAGNQTIWYDFVRLCSFMRIAPIIQGTTTTANDHFVGISNLLRIPNLRLPAHEAASGSRSHRLPKHLTMLSRETNWLADCAGGYNYDEVPVLPCCGSIIPLIFPSIFSA